MDKFENYDIFKILDNWQKCIPHLIFLYIFLSQLFQIQLLDFFSLSLKTFGDYC